MTQKGGDFMMNFYAKFLLAILALVASVSPSMAAFAIDTAEATSDLTIAMTSLIGVALLVWGGFMIKGMLKGR